ncbi:MAG: hypothetical protein QOI76_4006 [Frankiales bacterium]|jgi:uncharacterized protein (DUF1697 family)|nr:hypothetical protein [Frankiales bacterium]
MATPAPVWVALLRGVNVGSSHRVTMVELRAAVEGAGGTGVTTHIQSGNILLSHATKDRAALTATLREALEAACGFAVPVVLRTGTELADLVARCPFSEDDWAEDRRRYVSFLSAPPDPVRVATLLSRAADGESLYVTPTEVCAAVRRESPRPAYADIDRILKIPATARAWNVVEKLANLATR